MSFRIADTFTDSLAKLTGQEQKAAKTTAFDLQLDPTNPGMQLHRIDRSKDPNFWSVRVSRDLRLIVHKTVASLLLCYVGHHDGAYAWAERRKIERHPKTGAAQLVEVRERVEEIIVRLPAEVEAPAAATPPLFAEVSDDDLLAYGVPPEWLDEVRRADEDSLFDIAERLPQEAAEALLDLATGTTPEIAAAASADADPFAHPDAQRRFRVLTNVEELERALEYPWEKWSIFLHPAQRRFVERDYGGPARISGSAGTGKTVVALHRAVLLARRHPEAKVLLTTFSKTLANALRTKLHRMVGNEPAVHERVRVRPITEIGYEIYTEAFGQPNMAPPDLIRTLLAKEAEKHDGQGFSPRFVRDEWASVVDAWQLTTWEAYRDVPRLGRKTRIGGKQRERLWSVFEGVRAELARRKLVTWSDLFGGLTEWLEGRQARPFAFAVVDEAQDIGIAELRFLAALGTAHADSLFFAGDLGQRIFQQPFSWRLLGVDIRGRSHTLRVNYRTSHQIRSQADRLLPAEISDVDGNAESRRRTVSVFNGAPPSIRVFDDAGQETKAVAHWIAARIGDGCQPHEIGVFVRSPREMKRARAAAKAAGVVVSELTEKMETPIDHLALGDAADLDDVYDTERHLLYVACTRARDHLLVTGVKPASEFLDDLIR